MQLREYQQKIAEQGLSVLQSLGIVYLALEMRVGKTLIALTIANMLGAKRVLFTSKKKALSSIKDDYEASGYNFQIDICNYEQLHKFSAQYDLVIVDEAHCFSAYPKPSNRTKILKKLIGSNPMILLSGTPTPESYSQIYHQFDLSKSSPFSEFKSFYSWAREYVNIKERWINGLKIADYSQAKENKIKEIVAPYMITFTQEEAGFNQIEVEEEIVYVEPKPTTLKLADYLLKEKIYEFPDGQNIICDSAVKLQSKIHQICSGTIKTDSGSKIIDISKASYIKENFSGLKIAIFYKFIAEGEVLKKLFPNATEDPDEFNRSADMIFISQIQSGSMGVNLETADMLLFYNIDFSSTLYWQARARIQNYRRTKKSKIVWLFAKGGIEDKVMRAVQQKKDYTLSYFRRDYGIRNAATEQNNKTSFGDGLCRQNHTYKPKRYA